MEVAKLLNQPLAKLKLLDRECGSSGFTSSILGLAACFGAADCNSVAKAFEAVNLKDVEEWGEKFVGETIQKKRRRILKFKKAEDLGPKLTRFIEREIVVVKGQM